MVSDYKKHQLKIAGIAGLVIGLFMFLVFWAVTNKWYFAFIIPIAGLMGLAQAYLSPEPE